MITNSLTPEERFDLIMEYRTSTRSVTIRWKLRRDDAAANVTISDTVKWSHCDTSMTPCHCALTFHLICIICYKLEFGYFVATILIQ